MSDTPLLKVIFFSWISFFLASPAFAGLDAPHDAGHNISCNSCHDPSLPNSPLLTGSNINDFCTLNCHNTATSPYSNTSAPKILGHTSANTSNQYGTWSKQCVDCHNPHFHNQKAFAISASAELMLFSGQIDAYAYDSDNNTSLLTYSGGTFKNGWDINSITEKTSPARRAILLPNLRKTGSSFAITAIDATTMTVAGDVSATYTYINPPTNFGVLYGQYIKSQVDRNNTPDDSSDDALVKFFDRQGNNSFADGDATYDGICEVCHTLTEHFRNDGNAPDQNHNNVGAVAGTNCIRCHPHSQGFAHGDGANGPGCEECHGHDLGYGGATGGAGSFTSHSTHTENDSDDLKGPNVACATCHDINNFPEFADGESSLLLTTVCDTCHSQGGTYDGVNDAVVGAKNNWDSAVYEADSVTLQAGKEKWCATCHDEAPSIASAVSAPNVIGDEDGAYTYGTGWGYYKTGHGLAADEAYPYKGGLLEPPLVNGASRVVNCDSCHDFSAAHIDGVARTFDDDNSNSLDPSFYRQSYRLQLVDAGEGSGASNQEPLLVPRTQSTGNTAFHSRLCFNCHDSTPFIENDNPNTNLETATDINLHQYHLVLNGIRFSSDWDGALNSLITCMSCHNVHGSTRLAMVRDGKLIDSEPGLMIWYNNDDIVSYSTINPDPPTPEDLPLSASTGTVWRGATSTNLCSHCHGNNNTTPKYRGVFQDVSQDPLLYWTGESDYVSDGVNPDSGSGGSSFTFRVEYSDTNNEAPATIEVWIDLNDDGDYDDGGEKLSMSEVDGTDTNYLDGKLYYRTESISKVGDGNLNYRFYATDGSEATGSPTNNSSVMIFNDIPTLAWTDEPSFVGDGVDPNAGGSGTSFEFRISYIEMENQAPTSIQVWIDENDNGSYEAGEKYAMTETDGGDTTYSDGKLYAISRNLSYAGDGSLNYRFFASDGIDDATGTPTSNSSVTVMSTANNPPFLDWVAANCGTLGVRPEIGDHGSDFEFYVNYTDADNECAATIQIWIDENDDASYEGAEKYDLTEDDPGDTTCTDGKLYTLTRALSLAGDNSLNYSFYATDGVDSALGEPITGGTVTVVDATTVRPSGSALGADYNSINTAVNAVSGPVLVYPNDDFSAATYTENVSLSNRDDLNVQSACGADLTIIDSATGNSTIVAQDSANLVLDGFSITGATNAGMSGIWVNRVDNTVLTLRNSKFYGNEYGIYNNDSDDQYMDIDTVEIYNNSLRGLHLVGSQSYAALVNSDIYSHNVAADGAAIYINGSSLIISKSIIRNNITSGNAAIYVNGNTATLTITNSIISENQGVSGGVFYLNNIPTVDIINTTFADNQATNGGVFLTCTGAVAIRNSVFWGNTASGSGHNFYKSCGGTNDYLTISDSDVNLTYPDYSAIYSLTGTGTMLNTDPLFVDAGADNYHIQSYSPVIDQAATAYAPADDIDGESRPVGAGDDMGADEVSIAGNYVPTLSWTGEANYTADGVNPGSASGGSSYTFRVDFTDTDNDAPVIIQAWIDENDDGAYSGGEKYTMAEVDAGDTDYTDGKRYSLSRILASAGDGTLNYRFYATDGTDEANGTPILNKTLVVSNNVPVLAWTGEAGYSDDGVNPNSAIGGTSYVFHLDYTDADNNAPSSILVWVDENDSGSYEADEKYTMTATDGGDSDYTDGKRYTYTKVLNFAGDGNLSYRFYASDGAADATGSPVTDATLTVTNNVPTLAWTGEANYTTDGVDPDSDNSGSSYTFRVDYTDTDNAAPSSILLWIDENDNSSYEEGEKYAMSETDGGDTTYTDGKRYSVTRVLSYTGDGVYNYRFSASDGTDAATGSPTSDSTVEVLDVAVPPGLDWTGESGYTSDGVGEKSGPCGGEYTFRVRYTQSLNNAPVTIQVWLDKNDDGDYLDAGEKIDLGAVDGGDSDYTDGKLYTVDTIVSFAGDGTIPYLFYANDGTSNATGNAIVEQTVSVVDAVDVPGEAATIQAGIDAAADGQCVLVSNGTYSENIVYPTTKGVKVQSVYGAGSTTIQGSGANAPVVDISSGSYTAELHGFTLDNQRAGDDYTRGILVDSGSAPLIKNCIIQGNPELFTGGGILLDGASTVNATTVLNTTITNNSAKLGGGIACLNSKLAITNSSISGNTVGNDGGGIYAVGSTLIITDSSIDSNIYGAAYSGGGIYLDATSSATISGGTIKGNSGGRYGGGLYAVAGSTVTITGATVDSNSSGRNGAGLYLGSGATLTNVTISNNTVTVLHFTGGGIYVGGGTLDISRSSISGNKALYGGGIGSSGTVNMTNCIVSGNISASREGGGIFSGTASVLNVYNSTISGNYAATTGGGVNSIGTSVTFINSIIWGNTAVTSGPNISGATTPTITYSNVQDGYAGDGNINANPRFVDFQQATSGTPTSAGDFRLCNGADDPVAGCTDISPCIDTASATSAPADDIEGDSRPYDVSGLGDGVNDYDMGADEYVTP